ncbi:hypothetical protein HPB50_001113 [Hyalomma asiaticum]|uniref:Uncharacterized protein n=1 Tax=Hyalomma asiaticum TaxID=266040 RepID=A0ACB7RZJ4_HYAAI|nr:hypothetical protein HPB50_001113 [Hyalomma asiaticum]
MFALVKFVEEFDSNRLYVVDSHSILDFHPRNTNDFDNRSVYSVFWVDEENHDNTRAYKAQVLLLAESREELETKKSSKLVQIPKIRMEESSGDEWESKKQEHKQASQKRKSAQARARAQTYEQLLSKHVKDTKEKARGEPSCSQRNHRSPSPKKTRWSTETSSGDESLISSAELRREIAEKMWRSRAEKLEKQNELLLEQVASLQRCLESKIFQDIITTASQAAKILNNKKPTLVCKDTAQAIWGTDGLAERSVCGVAAPKARAAGELPKQPLTPRKARQRRRHCSTGRSSKRLGQAVMVYAVEGEQIDPVVLSDGSWQHPKCPADPLGRENP